MYNGLIQTNLDKTIVNSFPNSIRIDTIIELKREKTIIGTLPYFAFGCPKELDEAQHRDSVCHSCMSKWEKAGYRFGHILDFSYSLKLVDSLRKRGW